MPTPFVNTTLVLLTVMNNAGQLAAVEKADLPPGYTTGPIMLNESHCMLVRGKMANPEKYVCQVYRGPKETAWVFKTGQGAEGDPIAPAPTPEHDGSIAPSKNSFGDVAVGPSKLAERDIPTIDPYTPPPKEKARRVAQGRAVAPLHRPASARATYDANPFAIIASLVTGSRW
jgi:hypothetical protein